MMTSETTHNLGDRISLFGLTKPGMNGKKGTIVSLPDASNEGRYGVRVDGSRKPVAIKPANIMADFKPRGNETGKRIREQVLRAILQKGDKVTLCGLKTAKLNGRQGIIVALADSSNEGRYGVRIDGERKPMRVKATNLRPLKKSTSEYKEELDSLKRRETVTNAEYASSRQMQFIRMMLEMAPKDVQVEMFGRVIEPMPDFRLEVMKQGGYPKYVDLIWANKLLHECYENGSSLPHMMELYYKRPEYQPRSHKEFEKRLKFSDHSKLDWYFSPRKIGDIFPKSETLLHADCMRYSFSNQAYKKQILTQGKTHVAVGFVDLGILVAADVDVTGGCPLRFVGIDSSPYVVAKTHLIWELIQQADSLVGNVEEDSYPRYIAQVWFSSTWAKGTEDAVRAALCSLLALKGQTMEPEVCSILEHWFKAPSMPLKEARVKLRLLKSTIASIGVLARKCDRIDVAKYVLTGDFCVPEPICGNIILLDCPDGTPPPHDGETVFSALDFHQVMKIANENPRWTIMEAAEKYALDGMTKLVSWCSMNLVSVELKCSAVQDAIEEISSMRPWTMSWSNVLDYIDPNEFHRLARECSRHGDVIHFGYSMNWTTDVWGTNLIDFSGVQFADFRKELIDKSNECLHSLYHSFRWGSYFRFPMPQNPINTVGKLLQIQHYRDWTNHFIAFARRDGLFCELGTVEPEIVSPLSSTGHFTVSFTWTYDPSNSLRGVSRPSCFG